jgi:hypothetical protein
MSAPTNADIVGALRLMGLRAEEVQPGDFVEVWGDGCRRGWLHIEVDPGDDEEPLSLWVDSPDPFARICGGIALVEMLVMVPHLLRAGVAAGYGDNNVRAVVAAGGEG